MPHFQSRLDKTQIAMASKPFEPLHAHGDIKVFNAKGELKKIISAKEALDFSYEKGGDFASDTTKNLKKKAADPKP